MSLKAICVSCGKPKRNPYSRCKSCNYEPETEYQISRALIFSASRVMAGVNIGRDHKTLKQLSKTVMAGRPYEFDPVEIEKTVAAYRKHRGHLHKKKKRNRIIFIMLALIAVLTASLYLYNIVK